MVLALGAAILTEAFQPRNGVKAWAVWAVVSIGLVLGRRSGILNEASLALDFFVN